MLRCTFHASTSPRPFAGRRLLLGLMGDLRVINIDRGDVGQRLDLVLQRHLRHVTAASRTVMAAEELPLEVIYEDEHLLAINKPAGMVVHPTYRHPRGTLMNALLWRARNWPADARPSLVGRLDRLTSGALIAAKSRTMHAALQRVLSSPRSEKQYLAVVYGRVNVTRGTLDAHLSRSRRKRRTVIADSASGSPSQTVFERLRRIEASPIG